MPSENVVVMFASVAEFGRHAEVGRERAALAAQVEPVGREHLAEVLSVDAVRLEARQIEQTAAAEQRVDRCVIVERVGAKPVLYVVAQLGIGLYMFLVGLDFRSDDYRVHAPSAVVDFRYDRFAYVPWLGK